MRADACKRMIQALVFDFDGLILETEEADYLAWRGVFEAQAAYLPLEVWVDCIGRGAEYFDPPAYLKQRLGRPIERARLIADHDARFLELVHAQSIRPGVREYTEDAKRLRLKLGIASSSSRAWVTGHLDRLALSACWDSIRCREDVLHAKPEPELYDAVLTDLRVPPEQAVAIEDSPNLPNVRALR